MNSGRSGDVSRLVGNLFNRQWLSGRVLREKYFVTMFWSFAEKEPEESDEKTKIHLRNR